jgi:hypothetical protein
MLYPEVTPRTLPHRRARTQKRADRVQRPAHASALIAGQAAVAPDTPGTWVQLAVVAAESAEVIIDCGVHVRADNGAPSAAERCVRQRWLSLSD